MGEKVENSENVEKVLSSMRSPRSAAFRHAERVAACTDGAARAGDRWNPSESWTRTFAPEPIRGCHPPLSPGDGTRAATIPSPSPSRAQPVHGGRL